MSSGRSKSKKQKKIQGKTQEMARDYRILGTIIIPILAVVFSVVIGYLTIKVTKASQEIDLRDKIESRIIKLSEFSKVVSDLLAEVKTTNDESKKRNINLELDKIENAIIPHIMQDIVEDEKRLAYLIGKEPRNFNFIRFVHVRAPTNFSATPQ